MWGRTHCEAEWRSVRFTECDENEQKRLCFEIPAGHLQKPGQRWTSAPKGSSPSHPFSSHCNSPPQTCAHAHTLPAHTVLRSMWPGEGYLPLSDKDSATADISRPRHLGHDSGVNVCHVCLMQPSWSRRRIMSAGSPDIGALTGDRGAVMSQESESRASR